MCGYEQHGADGEWNSGHTGVGVVCRWCQLQCGEWGDGFNADGDEPECGDVLPGGGYGRLQQCDIGSGVDGCEQCTCSGNVEWRWSGVYGRCSCGTGVVGSCGEYQLVYVCGQCDVCVIGVYDAGCVLFTGGFAGDDLCEGCGECRWVYSSGE
jgi:hypothetical protein